MVCGCSWARGRARSCCRRTARAGTGTSDGPHFAGWEIYHVKGSPADPDRLYASQSGGWFGQLIQRSDDGGRTWNAVGNEFSLRGRRRHPPVLRRHLGPLEVHPGVAPRAVAARPRHDLRRGGGRRAVPLGRRRRQLAGAARSARPRHRSVVAARGGRDVPAHDPARPARRGAHDVAISAAGTFRTDDGGKTWRAINRGLRSEGIPDPDAEVGHCVHHSRCTPIAPGHPVHAEALGRHAHRRRRRALARDQRRPAHRLRLRRSTCTPTSPRPSTSSRSPATTCTCRSTASCGSTAAAPAATSGSR